jgi:hypothetical protein
MGMRFATLGVAQGCYVSAPRAERLSNAPPHSASLRAGGAWRNTTRANPVKVMSIGTETITARISPRRSPRTLREPWGKTKRQQTRRRAGRGRREPQTGIRQLMKPHRGRLIVATWRKPVVAERKNRFSFILCPWSPIGAIDRLSHAPPGLYFRDRQTPSLKGSNVTAHGQRPG